MKNQTYIVQILLRMINMRLSWCGCLVILLLVTSPVLTYFSYLIFRHDFFPSLEEHLSQAKEYSLLATDHSYFYNASKEYREFSISESAFLEMCEEREWNVVTIESLSKFPANMHTVMQGDTINDKKTIPIIIVRYLSEKTEHERCHPFEKQCKIEPSGRSDKCCFRSVSDGYYYEKRFGNGGEFLILYDNTNGRFYKYWSRN